MLSIFVRTVIIYILLGVSIKFMGKRQIGELEVSELVTTLLISEVAALPIADTDIPLLNAIIPVLLLVCLEIIISYIKNKSETLKSKIEGESTFIIFRGKLIQSVLEENRISINEVLSEMRSAGIGNIKDVYYAILEQNGKISFLEKENGEEISHTVIIDTEADERTLKRLGYDLDWLKERLKENGVNQKEVFLMTANDSGKCEIIKKEIRK